MLDWLLATDGLYVPRKACGAWPDWQVWADHGGNALVALCYLLIPLALVAGWRRLLAARTGLPGFPGGRS